MRKIVHLSDLHFGRIDHAILEPLARLIGEIGPDLVAVSGDLTQRARIQEFCDARAFLDSLPLPQIVIPGNHDVPMHNVYARFVERFKRFRRYISEDLEPSYADDEIAVIGINTARALTIKGGRINALQVARIREWLCPFGPELTKIVVTHHPFDLPEGRKGDIVGRARMVMEQLANCGADLFLSGHLHLGHTGHTAIRYRIAGLSALIVQAGTATSTRMRGEVNSFNVIRIERPEITVERMSWNPDPGGFGTISTERFRREDSGWLRL